MHSLAELQEVSRSHQRSPGVLCFRPSTEKNPKSSEKIWGDLRRRYGAPSQLAKNWRRMGHFVDLIFIFVSLPVISYHSYQSGPRVAFRHRWHRKILASLLAMESASSRPGHAPSAVIRLATMAGAKAKAFPAASHARIRKGLATGSGLADQSFTLFIQS